MQTLNILRLVAFLQDELKTVNAAGYINVEDGKTKEEQLHEVSELLFSIDCWGEFLEAVEDGKFKVIGYERLIDIVSDYRYEQSL